MKIYVVTAGEYSDYHIIGCRTSMEEAEKLKVLFTPNWEYGDIPEIEVYDTEEYSELAEGKMRVGVEFDKDKNFVRTDLWPTSEYFYQEIIELDPRINSPRYLVKVYAFNEEGAKKIAKDRLMKYLAEKEEL